MNQIMNQRKARGITPKLFLIETIERVDDLSCSYIIMGSTGNVYNVVITNKPSCTCPDYIAIANRCKHIYFVLLRIMKVINADKERYSDKDLKEMFINIPEITKVLCVNEKIRNKYITSKKGVQAKDDDLCPICLEDINNGEQFEHCQTGCGKCVHSLCFNMWCLKNPPKCLTCKSPWGVQKYINLNI